MKKEIFSQIQNDLTLSALLDDGNGGINLYPNYIPNGSNPETAMTYTQISETSKYPAANSCIFQFSCFSNDVDKTEQMANGIIDLFDERQLYGTDSHIVFSKKIGRADMPFDAVSGLYGVAIDIYFKFKTLV